MKNRQRFNRIPTQEALTQLINTEPNETQFNAVLEQLDDYISAQLAGEADEARFPGVAAYLDSDPRLAEIYDRLYRLEVDARADTLEIPASFPEPDLSFLPRPDDIIPAFIREWARTLMPDQPILAGLLPNLELPEPALALRGDDNTAQQHIYYADSYCIFINITPGIVEQMPSQIDGNIMNEQDPNENYAGTVYLFQKKIKQQEVTLDEFGFFGLDGVEKGEYGLFLALDDHLIWIEGLVVA